MNKEIRIKSFNGIGDLLFLTPSLRVIKYSYPRCRIVVNTNLPELLRGNPYVDKVENYRPAQPWETDEEGIFLGYPDPKHGKIPQYHHIISDWKIICNYYGLITHTPALKPEIHFDLPKRGGKIRAQILQKGNWHNKKSWPYFEGFCERYNVERITQIPSVTDLVRLIAESRAVVCIEGGISHIAKAVGTPAVVIFGGFAHPYWSGYNDQVNIINEKECSFCYNPAPCTNSIKQLCMREIIPELVYAKLNQLLEARLCC